MGMHYPRCAVGVFFVSMQRDCVEIVRILQKVVEEKCVPYVLY